MIKSEEKWIQESQSILSSSPSGTAVERWDHTKKRAYGSQGCLPESVTWFHMNGVRYRVVSDSVCVV